MPNPPNEKIKLLIKSKDGTKPEEFEGWATVSITRSMETLVSNFTMTYNDKWLAARKPFGINAGDTCEIRCNDVLVLTGYVDECTISYGYDTHSLTVNGRSSAADLVDCSVQHKTGHWKNIKLDKLATEVCKPFGITVTIKDDIDIGKAWPTYSIQEGESVWEFLERGAREVAVLFASTPDGMLVIEAPGKHRASGELILGKNIITGELVTSWHDRFSEYVVKQHHKEDDSNYQSTETTPHKSARDPAVGRYRPLTVVAAKATSLENLQKRALWECNVRAARAYKFTFKAAGWTSDGTNLWVPNRVINVQDVFTGIKGDGLIVGVTMTRDNNGTVSELMVMAKEAYSLTPILPKTKREREEDWLHEQMRGGAVYTPYVVPATKAKAK